MLTAARALHRLSVTRIRVYGYPGSNCGLSCGLGNLANIVAVEIESITAALITSFKKFLTLLLPRLRLRRVDSSAFVK